MALICTCASLPALPIWLLTSLAALVTTGKCLRSCSKFALAALLTDSSVFAFSSLSARAADNICAESTRFFEDWRPTVSNSRAFWDRNWRASDISSFTDRIRIANASLSVRNRFANLPKRMASRLLLRMDSSHRTDIKSVGMAHVAINVATRSLFIPNCTSDQYVRPKNADQPTNATNSRVGTIYWPTPAWYDVSSAP